MGSDESRFIYNVSFIVTRGSHKTVSANHKFGIELASSDYKPSQMTPYHRPLLKYLFYARGLKCRFYTRGLKCLCSTHRGESVFVLHTGVKVSVLHAGLKCLCSTHRS